MSGVVCFLKPRSWAPVAFRSQDWNSRTLDNWESLCNLVASGNYVLENDVLDMVQQGLFGGRNIVLITTAEIYWIYIHFALKYTVFAMSVSALLGVGWAA